MTADDRARRDERLSVNPLVRQKALHLGSGGRDWLADLPGLVASLEKRWSVVVVETLPEGSASFVARARTADGRDAVIKIAIPDGYFAQQVHTIERANGRGYVKVLAEDISRCAVLLEALGPSMDQLVSTPEEKIEALCVTLVEAWMVPRSDSLGVAPGEEKACSLRQLVTKLWERLDRPCSEHVVAEALGCAARRSAAFDIDRCVVVHGDPHPGNALQVLAPREGAGSGFVFVDPDGFLADPAYDLGVVLRDWSSELLAGDAPSLARRYCRLLASHTGIDEQAIWEWGFLERVSTGLYLSNFGAHELGRKFLDTAERLV